MASYTWSDIGYNWGPTLASFAELKEDTDVLRTSIINILLTRRGERVMRPTFGSLLPGAVFEPNDLAMVASLRESARTAIEQWDDRIKIVQFTAERKDNALRLTILFQNAKDPMAQVQTATIDLTGTEGGF